MNNKVLSLYDWFLIIGVIASNIIYTVLSGNVDVIGSVAGIAGVLCVVLVAKGSIWNYLFGLVNVSMKGINGLSFSFFMMAIELRVERLTPLHSQKIRAKSRDAYCTSRQSGSFTAR